MKQRKDSGMSLALDMILSPYQAFHRLKSPEAAWTGPLGIYLSYLFAAILFYSWKPANFPPLPLGSAPLQTQDFLFWVKAYAVEPLLTAVWIALTVWFIRFLKGGNLPLKFFGAGLAGLLPLTGVIVSAGTALPRWALGLLLLGLGLLLLPGYLKIGSSLWKPLASLLLAVHAVSLALVFPLAVAVFSRISMVYYILEYIALFWSLGLITAGISHIADIRAPRAFAVTLLSVLGQLLAVAALYRLGVLPQNVLKALMNV